MFDNILVICDGNICRSPTAAALLAQRMKAQGKNVRVESAGLVGLEGHEMDQTARNVAEANGVNVGEHRGRKLDARLCGEFDLLLVMEDHQRDRLIRQFPQASGKVFKLLHWEGGQDIPDPFRRSREVHEQIFPLIERGVDTWIEKL